MHGFTHLPHRMQNREALSLLQLWQSRSIARTRAASSIPGNPSMSSRTANHTQITCERQGLIPRTLFDVSAPSYSPHAISRSAWPCESATRRLI
ncbi:hypothetical protein OE88DRAFT_1222024 [Heliocybe sulcata]|uniref:Uncharacterized protein n=1 Tax=Heliocybe sulcata TaxID=5364 RepID=A0A5C3MV83_9AGAM|nr:hypothetical protein OE88DRAFT_1222024 [Heliocybe sulcata]